MKLAQGYLCHRDTFSLAARYWIMAPLQAFTLFSCYKATNKQSHYDTLVAAMDLKKTTARWFSVSMVIRNHSGTPVDAV